MPENPIKAIDIKLAVINTMAVPLKRSGMSLYSIFSRIPAIITIAIKNPTAVANPFTTLSRIPYALVTLVSATPNTAQFVVISGRYTPKDSYSGGIFFFKNISTNCTNDAITKINTMVCKYEIFKGANMNL